MTDGVDIAGLISALSGSGDLAGRLSSVLSDGDAASKLSDALGNEELAEKLAGVLRNADTSSIVSPLGGSDKTSGENGAKTQTDEKTTGNETAAALPAIFGSLGGRRGMTKERRELFNALKPFVSERRRRAIDMLIGIERLTALFPGGN